MIGWTNPAALWALVICAAPVIIHLLRRHRAEKIPFPTLRFVRPSETAAVRLQRLSDPWLLLLRVAVLGFAVCAVAGPVLLTKPRLDGWNAITARAVVVDASASMNVPDADGVVPARLGAEAAQAEIGRAAYSVRLDAVDLAEGVRRAAAWLASAPPARRELVIVTDAQRGSIDPRALRGVADSIGIRIVSVGRGPESRVVDGPALIAGPHRLRRQAITVTQQSTAVTIEGGGPYRGFRVIGAADAAGVRLLDIAGRTGTFAPSADQPIALRFDTSTPDGISTIRSGWMLDAVLGVMRDPSVASVAASDRTVLAPAFARLPWIVAVERDGNALVSAAAMNDELLLQVSGAPDSLFAAAVGRAVLNARPARVPAEHEVAQIPRQTVAAWERSPAPVGPDAWRHAQPTDARWCWLLALAGLAAEYWLRSPAVRRRTEEHRRAA